MNEKRTGVMDEEGGLTFVAQSVFHACRPEVSPFWRSGNDVLLT